MSNAPMIAVIQFPGSNCEYETSRVLTECGFDSEIFRWNQHSELQNASPDGFVLPGGFSFQDRVRAGAVGAKEKIMDFIFIRALEGKPVLGICNGAQILVETGLVPGWEAGKIQASLAANMISGRLGYLSKWVFLKTDEQSRRNCLWLSKFNDAPIPIPIAHAEGRFVFLNEDLERCRNNIALTYCDHNGTQSDDYPVNPNGSMLNAAGITNEQGNVLAMMPHPERAFRMWQVPPGIAGEWGVLRREISHSGKIKVQNGPGALFFDSLRSYFGME